MSPWTETDPANRRIVEQRDGRARELLARLGPSPRRVLDLGCGRGEVLPALDLTGVGVDLSPLRLLLAPVPVARADGARLPFPDGTFDVALAFNVLSSIPDDAHRRAVADELRRVLGPGGIVLWYDQRWPNPGNRRTRPVRRRDLDSLFPDAAIEVEPITLAPPLARSFPRSYQRLHAVTALRSHLVGVIRPLEH